MKFLYVLVGSDKGFYCEQTLVSMASLKFVQPDAFITLLVDRQTEMDFVTEIARIKKYVNEFIIVPIQGKIPTIARSRYIKTSMRKYVRGDFLYVDADTVWNSPVDERDFTHDVMGVLDGHCLLEKHPLKEKMKKDIETISLKLNIEKYVNGGVLFSRDSDASTVFFNFWHEEWMKSFAKGIYIDMPSLNFAINQIEESFSLLPDVYNVQISRSWDYFPQSKIIHFFSGWQNNFFESPYLFQKKQFWMAVKKKGLDESVAVSIKNPLCAFESICGVYGDAEMKFRQTALYGFIADLYSKRNQKKTFAILEGIMQRISMLWR